jgi:hypothetical protein
MIMTRKTLQKYCIKYTVYCILNRDCFPSKGRLARLALSWHLGIGFGEMVSPFPYLIIMAHSA